MEKAKVSHQETRSVPEGRQCTLALAWEAPPCALCPQLHRLQVLGAPIGRRSWGPAESR